MVRIAALALLLAGCAISTDSFKGHGESGDWVRDAPFTKADFDHDRIACRADTWDAQTHPDVETGDVYSMLPMMRARQGMAQCLHERGWRRATEPKKASAAK